MDVKAAVAEATPKVDPENRGAAFLLASITAIAALFTALGVTGGLVGRMARNHNVLTGAAFVAALFAVASGFVAAYISGKGKEKVFLNVGIGFYLLAGVFAVIAAVKVWGDQPPPRVAATVESSTRGDTLDLTVDSSGLDKGERIHLTVWPLLSERGAPTLPSGAPAPGAQYQYFTGGLPLYQSISGPDADGNVDFTAQAHLEPDHPSRVVVQAAVGNSSPDDCFQDKSNSGCVILDLGAPPRPQLVASWNRESTPRPILALTSSADNVAEGAVRLRVFGLQAGKQIRLADAQLAPDSSGSLNQTTDIRVPTGTQGVCAIASTIPEQGCPPSGQVPHQAIRACVGATKHQTPLGTDTSQTSGQKARRHCRRGYRVQRNQSTSWIRLSSP
jgi:hypothetical protein